MDKVSWNESRHVYRYVEYWIRQSEEAASHEKRQHCECGDSDQTLPTLVQRQRFQACESSLVKKVDTLLAITLSSVMEAVLEEPLHCVGAVTRTGHGSPWAAWSMLVQTFLGVDKSLVYIVPSCF